MKRIIIFLLLALANKISAQLVITPGAQFNITGNAQLTLQNTDLINNGNFIAGNGIITFSGNAPSAISGSQPLQFYQVEINKTGTGLLSLQKAIAISNYTYFTSGNIDLNGFNINLGTTGFLIHELETSHIIGSAGGKVIANAVMNAPIGANPGNLGAYITSQDNMGNVIVARGHQSQVNGAANGNSILRYYDITPATISNDAVLRIAYLDAELNGLPESSLVLWNSADNTHWTNLGSSANDISLNYAEQTTAVFSSRFTLSSTNNALPVRFILFNTQCKGSSVLLNWKTAQEQNSHYYTVERSADGTQWAAVGNVPAAGNAVAEHDYSYTDNSAIANSYYRIAEYDMDGKVQFSKLLLTDCGKADLFSVWPNPVSDLLYISMSSASPSNVVIKVFDNKGTLVKQQAEKLLPGNNLFSIDVNGMAAGLYYTTISNNSGLLKTQKIIKK